MSILNLPIVVFVALFGAGPTDLQPPASKPTEEQAVPPDQSRIDELERQLKELKARVAVLERSRLRANIEREGLGLQLTLIDAGHAPAIRHRTGRVLWNVGVAAPLILLLTALGVGGFHPVIDVIDDVGRLGYTSVAALPSDALAPAHAHLNLVGWATLGLMGTFYAVSGRGGWLGWANFAFSTAGVVVMIPSLAMYLTGKSQFQPGVIGGSTLAMIGMALFLIVVLSGWRSAKAA